MTLTDAYKKIAKADTFEERTEKLMEEMGEALLARNEYRETLSEAGRKHLIEELADVSVCVEILVESLGERQGFEAMKRFKTYRELCRRWLGQPDWCATTPPQKEDGHD